MQTYTWSQALIQFPLWRRTLTNVLVGWESHLAIILISNASISGYTIVLLIVGLIDDTTHTHTGNNNNEQTDLLV